MLSLARKAFGETRTQTLLAVAVADDGAAGDGAGSRRRRYSKTWGLACVKSRSQDQDLFKAVLWRCYCWPFLTVPITPRRILPSL